MYTKMSSYNIFVSCDLEIQVCMSPKWHARRVAIEFMQNMIFCNLFNARPYAQRLRELLLKCLFDERVEVRRAASTTLSGFYQCGYFQVTQEDLVEFFFLLLLLIFIVTELLSYDE
jgi:hypothetical protein